MAPYRVLTLDGGGIRGLFTARVLERIVAAAPEFLQRIDLVAGTSTGGILALAIAAEIPLRDVVSLYRTRAKKIFDDSWFDNLRDLGNAVGSEYDNKNLKQELVRLFGQRTLATLQKRVLVPSFDLDAEVDTDGQKVRMWKPKFFHNYPGDDSDGKELAVDVALRTSAAPTYFPAYQGYIDGGVVVNNPSMTALAQALDKKTGGASLDDVRLLAVGTGTHPRIIKGQDLDWGWTQWARPLTSLMIDGVAGVADYECRKLLADNYRRIDHLFRDPIDMDATDDADLDRLLAAADSIDLAATVKWLRQVW